MTDIAQFKARHKPGPSTPFPSEEINRLDGKLPQIVINFLKEEGNCSYGDFFRTILPDSYHDVFTDWGFDGSECYAFMHSVFGNLIYFYKDGFYGLNPNTGQYGVFMDSGDAAIDFSVLMNNHLVMDLILNSDFMMPLFQQNKSELPILNDDEIYALTPAIPLGGSPETSKIEVVKIQEQLAILAELYGHKAIEE